MSLQLLYYYLHILMSKEVLYLFYLNKFCKIFETSFLNLLVLKFYQLINIKACKLII